MRWLRWADKNQWLVHGVISGAWAFVGAQVLWLGSPVFAAFVSAFYAGVVGATMKEATDQTVYDALQLGGSFEDVCDYLGWHGWDWMDWTQHVVGAFIGAWAGIAFYFGVT